MQTLTLIYIIVFTIEEIKLTIVLFYIKVQRAKSMLHIYIYYISIRIEIKLRMNNGNINELITRWKNYIDKFEGANWSSRH